MITLQISQLPSKFHDYTPYVTITLLMSRFHSKYHIIYPIKLQNISVDPSYYLNIFFFMYFGADKLTEGRKENAFYLYRYEPFQSFSSDEFFEVDER